MGNRMSEKTRFAIKKAFSELVKEKKSLQSITVTDITTRADINRSTFYSHYENISAIAEEYKEEILGTFQEVSHAVTVDEYIDQLFLYLEKNKAMFSLLLEGEGVLRFIEHLASLALEYILDNVGVNENTDKALELQILVQGIAQSIIYTMLGRSSYTLEEVNSVSHTLIHHVLS